MASSSGAPKISLSFGVKKSTAQPRPQLGKRPRSALQDDQEDEEKVTAPQTITGFENGTTIGVDDKPKQGIRSIPALKNRDFGEEARRKRQRSGLPDGTKDQTVGPANGSDDGEPKQYGLILNGNKRLDDAAIDNTPIQSNADSTEDVKPKTADELAMDALLGKQSSAPRTITISEDDAYRDDMGQVPEAPDAAAYAAMPVDDFGKALLAGMGWKEGQAVGRRNRGKPEAKPRDVQRRPEQLGLGAREDALLRAESGADRKARMKGAQNIYNPVVMRSKATGKTLTENELKARQEQQKLELRNGNEDRKGSRDGNYDRRNDDRDRKKRDDDGDWRYGGQDRRRDEHERRRHNDDSNDYSKHRSSKRDRSSSRDNKDRHHRRKERTDYARADKERDRRKRDDYYRRDS